MGIKKSLIYAGGLMVATGGPVTMFSASDYVNNLKQPPPAAAAASQQPGQADAATLPSAATAPTHAPFATSISNNSVTAQPLTSLADVLRFDVTVEWVLQRWPRVSTGLSHMQLQGYRVPLVSGTGMADVAGSLTYYFNAAQQAKRITLRGTTGDPSVLVNTLTARYQFARRLTNDPGWIVYEAVNSSDHRIGTLKIRSAAIIQANQPHTRFDVDLEIDRPD